MKKFKQFTATALALSLSLCLALTACSSDDTGDSIPDTNTGTTTPDTTTTPPVNEDNEESSSDDAGSSDEVTYESYLTELTAFAENFMGLQESSATVSANFSSDPNHPEYIQDFADLLTEMNEKFETVTEITPTEDMAEAHQNFTDSCSALIQLNAQMIEILEDDFINADEETMTNFSQISEEYATAYSEFATNIFAVADEIQAKMG
ncbi:MAG: hypothetical protein R3Y07_08220 [Eubacteriales bacterium]